MEESKRDRGHNIRKKAPRSPHEDSAERRMVVAREKERAAWERQHRDGTPDIPTRIKAHSSGIPGYATERNNGVQGTQRGGGSDRDEQDGMSTDVRRSSHFPSQSTVAFIKQEAQEKAREIKVKADEEFAIEKARLAHIRLLSEQQAIDAQYEKKLKGAEVAQKIAQSNLTNKARLRLLNRREEHLQDLFSTARNAISTLSQDEGRYTKFLEDVILQGFLQILEPSVTVHTRSADIQVAEKASEAAKQKYKEISGRDVDFEVVGDLSDDLAGGVKLVSGSNRISVNNTLDERLRLLEDRMLPEIRKDLFGINENRKFYT
ncbi:hypothetical protein NMY22_g14897 [Coprinellus aureogranulatus]|nr:hypothetical protein NMY22_g14897 [Coprinellus aureogranulatus]